MIVSYSDWQNPDAPRKRMKAQIKEDHHGKPVIVLEDCGAIDFMSFVASDYRVEEATDDENKALIKMFQQNKFVLH